MAELESGARAEVEAGAGPARLTRAFFARSALEVAPDLLGCWLVSRIGGVRAAGRIVEVEAYLGDGSDAASHSHRGPTPRNRSMFGPPARFYVYRSMGIHFCVNVVCEPAGRSSAVLLRAIEPLEGLEAMRGRRGAPRAGRRAARPDRELTRGPGKLTQALGVDLDCDGASALRGELHLRARPRGEAPPRVVCGPRIGLSKATGLPWRFCVADSPWATRSPHNRALRPAPAPPAGPGRPARLS